MNDTLYIAVHRWKQKVDPSSEAVLQYMGHCEPNTVLQPLQDSDLFMAQSLADESNYHDLLIAVPDQPKVTPNTLNIIFLHDTDPSEAELPLVLEEQKVILAMWNATVGFGRLLRTGTSEIGGTVYTTECQSLSVLDEIVHGRVESLGEVVPLLTAKTKQ